jgi:hypothetical protein
MANTVPEARKIQPIGFSCRREAISAPTDAYDAANAMKTALLVIGAPRPARSPASSTITAKAISRTSTHQTMNAPRRAAG